MKFLFLTTEKTTEFDAVVFGDQVSLNTTRTVVPAFAVLETMLTVGTLKLPSLLGFGEMREIEGDGVNNRFFQGHILLRQAVSLSQISSCVNSGFYK